MCGAAATPEGQTSHTCGVIPYASGNRTATVAGKTALPHGSLCTLPPPGWAPANNCGRNPALAEPVPVPGNTHTSFGVITYYAVDAIDGLRPPGGRLSCTLLSHTPTSRPAQGITKERTRGGHHAGGKRSSTICTRSGGAAVHRGLRADPQRQRQLALAHSHAWPPSERCIFAEPLVVTKCLRANPVTAHASARPHHPPNLPGSRASGITRRRCTRV